MFKNPEFMTEEEKQTHVVAGRVDYDFARRAEQRRDAEKTYLAYTTAALQGLLANGIADRPDLVFYYAEQMAGAHAERFKIFWEKENP